MPILAAAALALLSVPVLQEQPPPNSAEATRERVAPRSDVAHRRQGDLVLPARPRVAPTAPQDPRPNAAVPADRGDEFLRAVMELRGGSFAARAEEAAVVAMIGRDFDAVADRCVAAARAAEPDVVGRLMRVLIVHGTPEHAKDLQFLLLTRPLLDATASVVETMATIARDTAADRLLGCLTASRAVVRHHAAAALATRLRPEDAEALLALTQQADTDVRIKALRLLGSVPPTPPVRARLIAALGEDPGLADAAVEALIAHGAEPAADLQAILRRPARGRATGHAALALCAIEDATGRALLTEDMVEHLVLELDMPDPFQRSAVAIALASLAWRSQDTTGARYHDRQVVEALLDVVAPTRFVSHLGMLSDLAQPRLVRLAGRDLGPARGPWREWWDALAARESFVGARREIALDVENAGLAMLTFAADGRRPIVLRGERTAAALAPADADTFVIGGEAMTELVGELRALGFMADAERTASVADGRSVQLALGGVTARSDPRLATPLLDRMQAHVESFARENLWQLYRDPAREPDAVAFWRAELRWLDQHPDPIDRAARLKDRILGVLTDLPAERVQRAIDDLVAIPKLGDLITDADGLALAEAAHRAPQWDAATMRILELAMLAPGDEVWQRLVEVARERDAGATGERFALQRIFRLAGPDRVLEALSATDPLVRRAAIDEVAQLQDLRAAPRLLATVLAPDEPADLRQAAAAALGRIRALDAREPLIAMLEQGTADAELRRTCWIALARIGGEQVFPVLQRAFPSPDPADRRAIVQALGALRHPVATRELGNIFALRGADVLGTLALDEIRQQGDLLGAPALIEHLKDGNLDVRRQCALLLGEFQHPAAVPELMAMLSEDEQRLKVVALLAGITGQNLAARNDRAAHMKHWFESNGSLGQGDWLIQALDEDGVEHTLRPGQLMTMAGTSAVPELTRIVMEVEQPWLRCLAARLLRVTTGEDFGLVHPLSSEAQRRAICDRYRFLHDASQAASGR